MSEAFDDLMGLISASVPAPATVLDVGCGDGALVALLRERGYDAIGIDLREPAGPYCEQCALEDFAPGRRFDAVVARLSLHHTTNVGVAFARMRDLTADDGRLFLQEMAWEKADLKTLRWAGETLEPAGPDSRAIPYRDGTVEDVLRRWVSRYGELHTGAAMDAAAAAYFEAGPVAPAPFLAWVSDLPDLLARERAAIASGAIAAIGFVYAASPKRVERP